MQWTSDAPTEAGLFVVNFMWGSVSIGGKWHHNPYLTKTEGVQLAENIAAGVVCATCVNATNMCKCPPLMANSA